MRQAAPIPDAWALQLLEYVSKLLGSGTSLSAELPADALTQGRRRGTQPLGTGAPKQSAVAELRWSQLLCGAHTAAPSKRSATGGPDQSKEAMDALQTMLSSHVFAATRAASGRYQRDASSSTKPQREWLHGGYL